MRKFRVVHYLNQFFGQIGGEDKAGTPPFSKEGPVGPGMALKGLFGDKAEIVATVICGDTWFNENIDEAKAQVVKMIAQHKPDLVIAGPAFNAGRYGVACGAVSEAVSQELNIPVISGMYPENPGVEMYRRYALIVETGDSAAAMRAAIPAIGKLALKVLSGQQLGSPQEEGYIPRGIRQNYFAQERGSKRAVEMLIAKLKGQEYETEYPMPQFDRVQPNPAIADLSKARIALVTSGGIVPKGNPDHIESSSASKFGKYDIAGIGDLTSATHETAHGGYDPTYANSDADRVLPVDALRQLETEGKIGALHRYYYATVGNGTAVASAKRYAAEIAKELKNDGVDAVILTST
jgi:glycine reductase